MLRVTTPTLSCCGLKDRNIPAGIERSCAREFAHDAASRAVEQLSQVIPAFRLNRLLS